MVHPFEVDRLSHELIRFIPLGDSYTIGEGVKEAESFPSLLTKKLNETGITTLLTENLGASGFTSQNLIDFALPVLETLSPTFVTLLIGANDLFQGIRAKDFEKNVSIILSKVYDVLPDKKRTVIITIPDFTVTPYGKSQGLSAGFSDGLEKFNQIIKNQAKMNSFPVADIFPISREMEHDPSLLTDDLHPSAKEYMVWVEVIYPFAYKLLIKEEGR